MMNAMLHNRFLLSSRFTPIARARDSQGSRGFYTRGNEHGFVTWQDSLAKRDNITGLIRRSGCTSAFLAVWLVWKWLADIAVLVAVQTAILTGSVPLNVLKRPIWSLPWTLGTCRKWQKDPIALKPGLVDRHMDSNSLEDMAG
jgi:hypothetical protein